MTIAPQPVMPDDAEAKIRIRRSDLEAVKNSVAFCQRNGIAAHGLDRVKEFVGSLPDRNIQSVRMTGNMAKAIDHVISAHAMDVADKSRGDDTQLSPILERAGFETRVKDAWVLSKMPDHPRYDPDLSFPIAVPELPDHAVAHLRLRGSQIETIKGSLKECEAHGLQLPGMDELKCYLDPLETKGQYVYLPYAIAKTMDDVVTNDGILELSRDEIDFNKIVRLKNLGSMSRRVEASCAHVDYADIEQMVEQLREMTSEANLRKVVQDPNTPKFTLSEEVKAQLEARPRPTRDPLIEERPRVIQGLDSLSRRTGTTDQAVSNSVTRH